MIPVTNTENEEIHWIRTEIVVTQGTISEIISTQETAISRTPSIQAKSETFRMTGLLDLFVSSFIVEMKAGDETITHVTDPEIKYWIMRDKALLTQIRETSQLIIVEMIISKTHSVTVPIATVNPVVIVDDQIILQTNAKHASIANALDISAVIAGRPEPIRETETIYASGS